MPDCTVEIDSTRGAFESLWRGGEKHDIDIAHIWIRNRHKADYSVIAGQNPLCEEKLWRIFMAEIMWALDATKLSAAVVKLGHISP